MFRALLLFLVVLFLMRAVWRLLGGIVQGAISTGPAQPGGGRRGPASPAPVKMMPDPICGTYVVPGKALELARRGETLYFCARSAVTSGDHTTMTPAELQIRLRHRRSRTTALGARVSSPRTTATSASASTIGGCMTTPKNVSKGFMTPDMMVVTDLDGRKIAGDRKASSELKMHLQVYRDRPDARAVVHAHPPTATGFAVAGIPLDRAVLAEVVTTLGSIPIAEYATPSTDELPAACSKYLKAHDGLAARQSWRAGDRPRSLHRVSPHGDDRALREDQPGDAAARPREPALARGSASVCRGFAACTGSRRRRRCAPTTRRSCARRTASNVRWCRRPIAGATGASSRARSLRAGCPTERRRRREKFG